MRTAGKWLSRDRGAETDPIEFPIPESPAYPLADRLSDSELLELARFRDGLPVEHRDEE